MSDQKVNPVYLGINQKKEYPVGGNDYSPSISYPEYQFDDKNLSEYNQVYEMVREGFSSLGYDTANYGTKDWNPLGEFINEGDTVLIKPNWVMHCNKNSEYRDNTDCLITHPCVVRVIIDYVLIALKGTGRVIIADAPMQGCDLNELLLKTGYLNLFEFYKKQGVALEIMDLRQLRVIMSNYLITNTVSVNGEDQSVQVDLGKVSTHSSSKKLKFKVSDYISEKTNRYHHEDTHTYNINRNVLLADFIINIPKPKCHKLAGITSAQKNLLGIVFDKACLPHRARGAAQDGGDEYPQKSWFKMCIGNLEEKKLKLTEDGKKNTAMLLQIFIALQYVMIRLFFHDKILLGGWYGNDTIWKTVRDINLITRYSDKTGMMKSTPQRRILNIADMIIAGQGNGPVSPIPKNLGMILIGEDMSLIDAMSAKIMGFDMDKIPGITNSINNNRLSLEGIKKIYSNNLKYNHVLFHDFTPEEEWKFIPHVCWKGHIEK